MSWDETFGDHLRRLRTEAGLTQEELAECAGLSVRGISDLERGVNRHPYRSTVQRLIEALEIEDPQAAKLWALASRRKGPVLTTRGVPRYRVPVPPTEMVGREQEVATLLHLLHWEGRRLVTLTGTGGVGKTRLALEVARRVAGEYEDGAAFVSLAPVVDPALASATIATALSLAPQASASPEVALQQFLADRELFLVLDNFEHLLPAAEVIARLLAGAPKLKVLVTSREPLRLRGEQQITIDPLPFPPAGYRMPVEDVACFPALDLLAQRGREIQPGFSINADNIEAVVDLCRRLDGLPLALELAAAHLKYRSPQSLMTGLSPRLDLLRWGARDLPARQQTMRDTIAWSDGLLTEDERALFRRLAVFVGGCTLEAAGAVCTGNGLLHVPAAMTSLVEHSLVGQQASQRDIADEPRFVMLETIREYAWEQLEASGEAADVRQRHALYFLGMAEEGDRYIRQGTRSEASGWQDRLEREIHNLRGADAWFIESGQREEAVQLSGALYRFWLSRGYWSEGYQWLERSLDQADDVPEEIRARALMGAGLLAGMQLARFEEGAARCTEALEIYRRLGDRRQVALALRNLGVIAQSQGDIHRARVLFDESLELWRALGDARGTGLVLANIALILHDQGDLEGAIAAFEEARQCEEATNAAPIPGFALVWLAHLALDGGRLDDARRRLHEALHIYRQMGHILVPQLGLSVAGGLAVVEGHNERAARLYGAQHQLTTAMALRWTGSLRSDSETQHLLEQGREQIGPQAWDRAWTEGEAMTLEGAIDYALEGERLR